MIVFCFNNFMGQRNDEIILVLMPFMTCYSIGCKEKKTAAGVFKKNENRNDTNSEVNTAYS